MLHNSKDESVCRCPWCGKEINFLERKVYTSKQCPHCNKIHRQYFFNKQFWMVELPLIVSMSVLIFLKLFLTIIPMIIILYGFVKIPKPLIRYELEPDNSMKKHFIAKITFHKHISYTDKLKSCFVEKIVYPICFVDENDTPISHMVCVCVDSYKRKTKTAELSFLPLGEKFDDVESGLKFYIFDKGEKIGEGKVIQLYNQGKTA